MRRRAPVWQAPWGDVYLTGYDLVSGSLANRKLSHVPPADVMADSDSAIRDWLIYQEGSAHAALRQALQQPFVGKGMPALRLIVAETIEDLMGDSGLSGTTEVVAAFTRAVPERVICRLLGVPDQDMPMVRAWSGSIRALLDTGFDDAFGGANSADEMSCYFVEHLRHLLAAGRM
ncbi:hypothetical protein EN962_17075, partial [Mesorhizobium sp. M7A.F.Ca.CA.001.09.2.1]